MVQKQYLVYFVSQQDGNTQVKLNDVIYPVYGMIPQTASQPYTGLNNVGFNPNFIMLNEPPETNKVEFLNNRTVEIAYVAVDSPFFSQFGGITKWLSSAYVTPHKGYNTFYFGVLSSAFSRWANFEGYFDAALDRVDPIGIQNKTVGMKEVIKLSSDKLWVLFHGDAVFNGNIDGKITTQGKTYSMDCGFSNHYTGCDALIEIPYNGSSFDFEFSGKFYPAVTGYGAGSPYNQPARGIQASVAIYAGDSLLTGMNYYEFYSSIFESVNAGSPNPMTGFALKRLTVDNFISPHFGSGSYSIPIPRTLYNSQKLMTNARTLANVQRDILNLRAEILATDYPDQARKGIDLEACNELLRRFGNATLTVPQLDGFYQQIKAGFLVTKKQIEDLAAIKTKEIIKINSNFLIIVNLALGKQDKAYWLIDQILSKIGVNVPAQKPLSNDPLGGFELRTQDQLWRDELGNLFTNILQKDKTDLQNIANDLVPFKGLLTIENQTLWDLFLANLDDLALQVPAIVDNSPALEYLAGIPTNLISGVFVPQ